MTRPLSNDLRERVVAAALGVIGVRVDFPSPTASRLCRAAGRSGRRVGRVEREASWCRRNGS